MRNRDIQYAVRGTGIAPAVEPARQLVALHLAMRELAHAEYPVAWLAAARTRSRQWNAHTGFETSLQGSADTPHGRSTH